MVPCKLQSDSCNDTFKVTVTNHSLRPIYQRVNAINNFRRSLRIIISLAAAMAGYVLFALLECFC